MGLGKESLIGKTEAAYTSKKNKELILCFLSAVRYLAISGKAGVPHE